MTTYLILKWLHILSSVLLVGTGFGSAFYMLFTLRSGNVQAIATVTRLVVRADTWFTTPAIFIQPITGYLMARMAGFEFSQTWLAVTLVLYVLAGLCWLPVVWLQIRMSHMAHAAVAHQSALPALFWRYAWRWEHLGYPAFAAMLLIYGLMVFKPA
jgi:uncharacterized membrane protein